VEVPPLHELRIAAGQSAVSPEVQLTTLLANKQLPGTAECAACGEPTEGLIIVAIECERAEEKSDRTERAGCFLLGLLLGWIVLYRPARDGRAFGRDVQFFVPVRYCDGCAARLTESGLRTALRRNPVCAGVLDKYPHARVTRHK
jgi:hypothetical protein